MARLPSRRRRRPKPKTPDSDKYSALRAAKQAAAGAMVPAYPVPWKARADPDDAEPTLICPGCGVYMQDSDPKSPGYFKMPSNDVKETTPALLFNDRGEEIQQVVEAMKDDEDIGQDAEYDFFEIVRGEVKKLDEPKFTAPSDFDEADVKHLGEAWDHIIEGPKQRAVDRNDKLVKAGKEEKDDKLVVCARCHSLRYYGRVKEKSAENLLPDFDFDLMVGKRLRTAYGKRAVVLMVVDAVDFDGSFPRRVAKLLSEVEAQMASSFKDGQTGNSPKVVVVATKVDLLPPQLSPLRLEQWVRKRTIMGGAPRPSAVHLVSSTKGWGIQALTERIMKLAGPRGDVWVVGAQNAGKSSLINALARRNVGREEGSRLTEASHPGTTIGILKISGLLPANVKLYDTPGILHPHQLTTRLNEEEFKMVQIRKELKPRTYRIKVGHTLHVGGMLRLDLVEAPAEILNYGTMRMRTSPLRGRGVPSPMVGVKALVDAGVETLPDEYLWRQKESAASAAAQVPVVNLDADEEEVALAVHRACEEWSTFQILGHGIDLGLMNAVAKLIHGFFSLPEEQRSAFYSEDRTKPVRFGSGFKRHPSAQQQPESEPQLWYDYIYHICSPMFRPEDVPACVAGYWETTSKYVELIDAVARRLLRLMSKGLQLDSNDALERSFSNPTHMMRMNYYPPCPAAEMAAGIDQHTDSGGLTILQPDDRVAGLEIMHSGRWLSVTPMPGALLVNLGDMMEILTNGKYKSLLHRARLNATQPRISIASLYSPAPNTLVEPVAKGEPALYKACTYGDYLPFYFANVFTASNAISRMRVE